MLNSTSADPSAESYLSVADADAIAASFGLTEWATKSTEEKEIALRVATVDLEGHRFHAPEKWQPNQALSFPRQRDQGVIPLPVKQALIYQAEWRATAGQSDQKYWRGADAAPVKDAGNGSPLCPRAMAVIARYISRVGSNAPHFFERTEI